MQETRKKQQHLVAFAENLIAKLSAPFKQIVFKQDPSAARFVSQRRMVWGGTTNLECLLISGLCGQTSSSWASNVLLHPSYISSLQWEEMWWLSLWHQLWAHELFTSWIVVNPPPPKHETPWMYCHLVLPSPQGQSAQWYRWSHGHHLKFRSR